MRRPTLYYLSMNSRVLKLAAADIDECALFVSLMIAGAFIRIPIPMMPLTFQTFFAVLAGLLLGWHKGMISMVAYMLLGLIGLPVFTSGGGFSYVLMPSFGYILGFIASAGVAGICPRKANKLWHTVFLAIAAFLADYLFGIAYFIAVWQLNGWEGLWHGVLVYNVLYMPKDLLLSIFAAFISYSVAPAVKKLRSHGKRR